MGEGGVPARTERTEAAFVLSGSFAGASARRSPLRVPSARRSPLGVASPRVSSARDTFLSGVSPGRALARVSLGNTLAGVSLGNAPTRVTPSFARTSLVGFT